MADGREWPAVDLPDGSALVLARDVPALGYLALAERAGTPNPPQDGGTALEAQTGSFHVVLDPETGAIRSLTGADGRERVKPGAWSGLNELVYVTGGAASAASFLPAKKVRSKSSATCAPSASTSARGAKMVCCASKRRAPRCMDWKCIW